MNDIATNATDSEAWIITPGLVLLSKTIDGTSAKAELAKQINDAGGVTQLVAKVNGEAQ